MSKEPCRVSRPQQAADLLPRGKTKVIPLGMTFCFGGDKRDRTADLLNAIAPEVLDSVEMV